MSFNAYASLAQLKAALDIDVTVEDARLLTALRNASRLIDGATGRTFYPQYGVRYLAGQATADLWLDEPLLEVTEVALSQDNGATYSALAADQYWLSNGAAWDATPYQRIALRPTAQYGQWPTGWRTARVTGWWGWRSRYATAWEDSADAVQDDPLSAGAAQITVVATGGVDGLGLAPRFSVGHLVRLENEMCEVIGVTSTRLTVLRGANGSTAAAHAQGTPLRRWRPLETVEQAVLTQAARWFKRAQQAFADAGANPELGRLVYAKRLDPDVEVILLEAGLRRLAVG